jgi:hypothetical protein
MNAQRITVVVETDGSGNATAYSPNISGRIHSLSYLKDDFADGVDFTVTLERTGQSVWTDTNINASETVYPVAAANLGTTGAASTLSEAPIIAANDRLKIVVASGGDTKSGSFDLVLT